MLLHSRIDDNTLLYIDVEPSPGFAKDEGDFDFSPDEILDRVVTVSTVVARKLAATASEAASMDAASPSSLRLEFGIKVNGESVVMVAPNPNAAHFKITAEWSPSRS